MSEPPKSSPWWDCFGCSGRPESPEPAMEEERREQPRAMPAPSHEPNPRARMPERTPEPQRTPERTPEPQRTPEPERALELQRIAEPQRTPEPGDEAKKGSKLDYEALLKEGYDKAKELSMEGLVKGRMALERGLGLGQKPNAIPPAEATVHGPPRKVELGWHPVAGLAGKWFAEETGLGKMITEKIRAYPDPTQHWAVLVGDYCHQLWMDEKLDVIYNNERINRADWHTFEVGTTRFNDEALRQASEMVIHNMRQRRPAYNLISNNCQNFAVALLDAIHVGAQREFGTTFAIYQRATGRGRIMDLFEDHGDDRVNPDGRPPETTHAEAVNHAQQVMDENTQKVDTKAKASHRPLFH